MHTSPTLKRTHFALTLAFLSFANVSLAAPPTPAAPATTAPAAGADDAKMSEAKERYDRGIKLFDEGRFELAAIEFQRAYDLAPSYRILYNIGETQFQRGKYSEAVKTLEAYLKEGGSEVPGKRRLEVENDLDKLRTRVASLTVTSALAGAEVLIDDVKVGVVPLQSFMVDAGTHRITVQKEGFRPKTEQVILAGKDQKTLSIDPSKEGINTTIIKEKEGIPAYVWISWGVTLAFGAGTAVTGILANGAANDLNDAKVNLEAERKRVQDAQGSALKAAGQRVADTEDKKSLLTTTTWILGGATVVSLGLSVYLTVVGLNQRAEANKADETKPQAWIVPRMTPNGVDGFMTGFTQRF